MGGLEEPADGNWLQTFTIITTDADESFMPIHNRVPVILHEGDFQSLARDLPELLTLELQIDLAGMTGRPWHLCGLSDFPEPVTPEVLY